MGLSGLFVAGRKIPDSLESAAIGKMGLVAAFLPGFPQLLLN